MEAIKHILNYAKFLKDIISKRTKIEFETVAATEGCVAMLHNRATTKRKDLCSFMIPYSIGD